MYAIDNMFTMYYAEIIFTGFWCKYDAEHLTTASHSHRHTLHLITAMVFRQSGVSVDNRCRAQPLSSLHPASVATVTMSCHGSEAGALEAGGGTCIEDTNTSSIRPPPAGTSPDFPDRCKRHLS